MATGRKSNSKNTGARIVRYSRQGAQALASLNRNVRDTAALASTSTTVVNARLTDLNGGELVRMGPEKVLAAMSAGAAWMRSAYRLTTLFYQDTVQEAVAATAAARQIALSPLPAALRVQYTAMNASVERATARSFTVAGEILRAQREVLQPYRVAAGDNARRLRPALKQVR